MAGGDSLPRLGVCYGSPAGHPWEASQRPGLPAGLQPSVAGVVMVLGSALGFE